MALSYIAKKGFYDNVNHGKLLKQMWTMGIQDKQLLCIISAMLKAEIEGIGIPTKGVPQGGLCSPLFSNVVLNELDWWISDQWDSFETSRSYSENGSKFSALRKASKLKECYIIRYADDLKIMCRTRSEAERMFMAVKLWLKERLDLEISPEKSKITNLRKRPSEFLGFSIKAVVKGPKRVANSRIKTKNARCFSKEVNKFTPEGRKLIHKQIDGVSDFEFLYLTKNPVANRSIEYNDNRISLFSAQSGKCAVLGERLEVNDCHWHRILPINSSGGDKYSTLVIISPVSYTHLTL